MRRLRLRRLLGRQCTWIEDFPSACWRTSMFLPVFYDGNRDFSG